MQKLLQLILIIQYRKYYIKYISNTLYFIKARQLNVVLQVAYLNIFKTTKNTRALSAIICTVIKY